VKAETASTHLQQTDRGKLLRLDRSAVPTPRTLAEQSIDTSTRVRARASARVGSLSHRPRRADRHEPFGTCAARDSNGSVKLEFLLDRTRRQARGRRAELDRHVPAARHRSVHLSGRCAAASGHASGHTCGRAHAATVETALRRQSDALGSPPLLFVDDIVGNTWIIDLRHYLTPTGAMATDLPPRALLLAEYFASIVVDDTTNIDDPPSVRCRRRMQHYPCSRAAFVASNARRCLSVIVAIAVFILATSASGGQQLLARSVSREDRFPKSHIRCPPRDETHPAGLRSS
jgi:hypothetical protein